jgi:hypothetical protein
MGSRFSASLQTGPGAHQASYTMGTSSLPGLKRVSHYVNHHLHLAQMLKEEYSYTHPLCLHGMLQGEFYLLPSHKPVHSTVTMELELGIPSEWSYSRTDVILRTVLHIKFYCRRESLMSMRVFKLRQTRNEGNELLNILQHSSRLYD